ncbi:glycosyl hydrolase [Sphingomonas sp.]|uniref:glycosyl hydrolase n=1 Tax=Sphingomonas sp. TaxID=28214 RepID=UPI0031D06A03
MTMKLRNRTLLLLLAASMLTAPAMVHAQAQTPAAQPSLAPTDSTALEQGFRAPPASARPRVWWHWMNGNITKEGIAADIAWMKRVGIGGLQNFDVDLDTGQIVANRLAYMTPAWKDAFAYAAREADRQGLELAIASSPGWSETGGPWVPEADAMKKLVWSETPVSGGRAVSLKLAQPPAVAGPFQTLPRQPDVSDLIAGRNPGPGPDFYRDAKVLAVRVADVAPLPVPTLSDGDGKAIVNGLGISTDAVGNVAIGSVLAQRPPELRLDYGRDVTVRSATLRISKGAIPILGAMFTPVLECSADGQRWTKLATIGLQETPVTISFPAVTARHFRVVVSLPHGPGGGGPSAFEQQLAMENVFARAIGNLLRAAVNIGILQFHGEARVDQYETKAGYSIVPDYAALPPVGDGATGPAADETIDLTDRMKPDGTLDWTPPPGRWRVLRIGYSLIGKTNHPAPTEATGLEVDKYDGAAVARYLDHYLASYRDAAGSGLLGARGVRAFLTDSSEVGAANWTPRMIEQFRRLRGYDPTPWMPVLTGVIIGDRRQSDAFLYDYRRTLADLMSSEHYGTVARVAHQSGLKVYGESIEGNRSSFGDDMEMRRYTDYPMGAMWAFDIAKGPQPSFVIDIRGAASIAHLYGKNVVAAESMTAMMEPWAFGPADLKHIVDLQFALGVNRPVIHTSVHVPVEGREPGLSLGGIGQFFNRNESWAELATPWIDYIARNAYLLQQGRNVADVAYFYGEETPLSGLFGKTFVTDAPSRYAFDFLNADALMGALSNVDDEVVSVGGARYRVIYLGDGSRHLTMTALRRLATLAEGGATIVGPRPEGSPSLPDDAGQYAQLVDRLWSGRPVTPVGKGRVVASRNVEQALRQIGIAPDFAFDGAADADIPFVHRRLDDGDSYFLSNRKDRAEPIEAHFRVTGKVPEWWEAETGIIRPLDYRIEHGETIIPLTLAPQQAMHILFRKPATAPVRTGSQPKPAQLGTLQGPWTVAFQSGRGAPATVMMRKLAPLDENADPGVRYFSGIATYTSSFAAPRGWKSGQPLVLNLGEAREVAEVRVNGTLAGYAWHAPYTVDIGRFVKLGSDNTVEIRVANLWVNRLIRDADPAVTQKVSWTSVATYKPTAKLRRSGLIGPVGLETAPR